MTSVLQTLVINLDDSADRLDLIRADLDAAAIAWSRLPATEPNSATWSQDPLYHPIKAIKMNGVDLTRGEFGCFKSHLDAVGRFLEGEATHLLVLEDDASVEPDTAAALEDLLRELRRSLGNDWSCLNLAQAYGKRRRPLFTYSGGTVFRAYYFPISTAGLLWTRPGAHAFSAAVQKEGIYLPVDQWLRLHLARTGSGLSLERPIISLRSLPSTILSRPQRRHRIAGLRRRIPSYWHSIRHQIKRT